MADLMTLVTQMVSDGQFRDIAGNQGAQFGTPARRYIGAELLPDREVEENAYREENVQYKTVIANSGTRYSPAQKKGGEIVGSFMVELGNSDIAREISGRAYDVLAKLVATGRMPALEDNLAEWANTVLNLALLEHNEKQRWDAIVNAQILPTGDNGFAETINYSNPAGHRSNANGTWSSNSYDPLAGDILPKVDLLKSKGFTVNRVITSTAVRSKLIGNQLVRQAVLGSTTAAGSITAAKLNDYMSEQELPAIETYDLLTTTQSANGLANTRFMAANAMVFVCTTGVSQKIDLGVNQKLLENTLGYNAVGRAAGQSDPGRVFHIEAFANKPPRVEGEGWQTSLPVIMQPEALGVIAGIS